MQRPISPLDRAAGTRGALDARGQVAPDSLPALLERAHRSAQRAQGARGAQALPGFPPLWRSDSTTEAKAAAIMGALDARSQAAHDSVCAFFQQQREEAAHRSAQGAPGAQGAQGAQALPGFPPLWRSDSTTDSKDARGQAAHDRGQTMSAEHAARAGQGDAGSAREGQRTEGGKSWAQRTGGGESRAQLLEEAAEAAGVAGAMHVLDTGEKRALPTRKRQIEPARCAEAIASPAPVAVAVAHSYALYRAIDDEQRRPSVGRPSVVLPIATPAGATCATPPHVTCWLACDAEHFRAEFNICGEVAPRAQVHANNGEVWTDSCVEVFLAAPCGEGRDTGYLNFELSCTGALLAGHVVGGMARLDGGASPPTLLLPEEMAPIRVRTEGAGNAEWRAEIDVPWALIEARLGCARPGRSGAPASAKLASKRRCWRVNAYCIKDGGDESLRHYLSAFAVDEPHVGPFFHQPACFAPLAFLP